MATSNGKITAPVSITDVKTTLGVSSNDLGTLCKAAAINMWSRHKPVSYASVSGNNGGKGDGDFGITIPSSVDNIASVIAMFDGSRNGWGYQKPTGGASSPYRLGDFNGYYHKANPVVSDWSMPTSFSAATSIQVGVMVNRSEGDTEIGLNELSSLANYYFGICYVKGSTVWWCTASKTLGNGGSMDFSLPSNTFPVGTYTIYPILCTAQRLAGSVAVASRFIPCPLLQGKSITSTAGSIDQEMQNNILSLNCLMLSTNVTVASATILADGNYSSYTITNMEIKVYTNAQKTTLIGTSSSSLKSTTFNPTTNSIRFTSAHGTSFTITSAQATSGVYIECRYTVNGKTAKAVANPQYREV